MEKPGYQTPQEQQVDIASGASRRLTFKLDAVRTEVKPEKAGASEVAAAPDGKKNSGSQCQALTERVQLGETLTEEERAFLKDKCH